MNTFGIRFLTLSLIFLSASLLSSCQTKEEAAPPNTFDQALSALYERGQFNGNALVVKNGEVIYEGAFGLRNINPIDSLTINSVFRLGSVSKQFTAMGIMILKEQGKLNYDQDIRDFIPELPYEGVTIRHLLNHTGGLADYMFIMDEHWKPELGPEDPARAVSGNQDMIDLYAEHKPEPDFQPGDKWEYSNTGYVLLATIVARASGQSFPEFLKENIFDKCGMTHTVVYDYVDGPDPKMPERVYGFGESMDGKKRQPVDAHYLNHIKGDGGIFSTVHDLAKWDAALYTEKLVSAETLQEAFTPGTLNNGKKTDYGFGWFIEKTEDGKDVVSHSGGWVGFVTYIYRQTEDKNCVIVLTNNSSPYVQDVVATLLEVLQTDSFTLPPVQISMHLGKYIPEHGAEAAVQEYYRLKKEAEDEYHWNPWGINLLGYELLGDGKIEESKVIFKLNMDEHPDMANAYDSYSDALIAAGDTVEAIEILKKGQAISENPQWFANKIESLQGSK